MVVAVSTTRHYQYQYRESIRCELASQCRSTVAMSGEMKTLQRPALGRSAFLGDLYDASTESFLNVSMFNGVIPAEIVRSQDAPSTYITSCNSDSTLDMLDMFKLDIDFEMGIFVVIGTVSIKGGFGILKETKRDAYRMSGSLIAQFKTINEQLRMSHADFKNHINKLAFQTKAATHFVLGIDYGSSTAVTIEARIVNSADKDKIRVSIGAELDMFIAAFKAEITIGIGIERTDEEASLVYKIHTDLPECPLPDSRQAVFEYMTKIPELLKKTNNGKGKQTGYLLMPISALNEVIGIDFVDRVIESIDTSIVRGYHDMFDVISQKKVALNEIFIDYQRHQGFFAKEKIQKVKDVIAKFEKAERALKLKMQELTPMVKRKEITISDMDQKINVLRRELRIDEIDAFVTSEEPVIRNQVHLIQILTEKNIYCIGQDQDLEIELYDKIGTTTYIQFSREGDDNIFFYKRILNAQEGSNYYYVYLSDELRKTFQSGLYRFGDGNFDKMDENDENNNLVNYSGVQRFTGTTQGECMRIRCPGETCVQDGGQTWRCASCSHDILYHDDALFCLCGRGEPVKYGFRCSNVRHGAEYVSFKDADYFNACLENLKQ